MAEKIIDIKINAKEATKAIETLDKSILQLEDNVSEATRELNKMEAELSKVTGASGKDLVKRQQLNKRIAKTKAFIKEENFALKENNKQKTKAKKTTTDLNKKLKEQAKKHNEVSKGLAKTLGGTSALDRATGGLFSSFKGLTQGLGGATKGMRLFKLGMIATGVGAFVVILGSMITFFKSSEEGQNKLTKAFNVAGAAIANVVETVSMLGEGLLNIGTSIGKFFTGKGSLEDIGNSIVKTYDTVSEKISTIGEDIKEDVKVAMLLSDNIAKADKIDRKLLVERQKANVKINDIRTKAYDTERFNNKERIAFLEEAIKIEDGITNKEIESARLRFEAKKAENDMTTLVTKEAADEQAQLEAKLFQLEATKLNRQREVSNQRQMILRQEKKEEQKIKDDALKAEEEFDKMVAEKKLEKKEADDLAEEERLKKVKETAEKEIEAKKLVAQAEKQIQDQNINSVAKGFSLLSQLAGKNKALQAVALIGQSAAGIARTVIETQTANAGATAQGVALAIPSGGASIGAAAALVTSNNISAGIGIASNIVATAKGLQALKAGGAAPSVSKGSGGRQVTAPPSINVVGAAPENQLAVALGEQQDKPVQAFVVGSEVTSQQALDRNIVDNASLG